MDNWNADGYSFETDMSINKEDDDDMAEFEAACARMLQQEHERRAKEEKDAEIAAAAEVAHAVAMSEPDDSEQKLKPEPAPEAGQVSEWMNEAPHDSKSFAENQHKEHKLSHNEELAVIMQAESTESMLHDAARQNNNHSDGMSENAEDENEDESLPNWIRRLFTLLLILLGALGVYTMLFMDYHSFIFDPLCFIEIAVCLLTAVGLNASRISFRVCKEVIMRLAAYALFAFYSLYAADALFLKNLLSHGIDKDNALGFARANINADIMEGLSAMGYSGMIGCAMLMLPFAFMMLLLLKPFRNILLYLLTVGFLFFSVGIMRILTLSGSFDLAQGCMAFTGAVVAYVIFSIPPIQRLMSDAGLVLWEYDEEDY